MGVSKNNGIPKSSILIGFSTINHPFWDTHIFGNIHIETSPRFGQLRVIDLTFFGLSKRSICHRFPPPGASGSNKTQKNTRCFCGDVVLGRFHSVLHHFDGYFGNQICGMFSCNHVWLPFDHLIFIQQGRCGEATKKHVRWPVDGSLSTSPSG